MERLELFKNYARELKLHGLIDGIEPLMKTAQKNKSSYLEYSLDMLVKESDYRSACEQEKRLKAAKLPIQHNLDEYNPTFINGISIQQLQQLRELLWIDQHFNLLLSGPSGTGKTYIAAGLCFDALKNGYRALFRSIDQIVQVIKMKSITAIAAAEHKRLLKAQLLVIDDIMMFPLEKEIAVGLFQLVNQMFERSSFIITTNKNPKEWAQLLNDEALAAALLDRILYHCEVIKLSGKSYRLENRKTIFNKSIK
jgi:DNA replication protein DnaC